MCTRLDFLPAPAQVAVVDSDFDLLAAIRSIAAQIGEAWLADNPPRFGKPTKVRRRTVEADVFAALATDCGLDVALRLESTIHRGNLWRSIKRGRALVATYRQIAAQAYDALLAAS